MWIEWFYFFRNFREISRKMSQKLSHFAKNSKRESIATLVTYKSNFAWKIIDVSKFLNFISTVHVM